MSSTEPIITNIPQLMTLDEAVQYMKAIDRMYPINKPTIKWYDVYTGKPVVIGYSGR